MATIGNIEMVHSTLNSTYTHVVKKIKEVAQSAVERLRG